MATSHTSLIDNARIFFLWEYLFSVHAKSSGPWTHLGLEMEWRILALHCYNLGHFFQTSRDLSGYLSQPINLSIHHQSTLSIYLSINMSVYHWSVQLSIINLPTMNIYILYIYLYICVFFVFCFVLFFWYHITFIWNIWHKSEWSEVTQWCLTLWDLMDCILSGSSVHEIFQARILEWVFCFFNHRPIGHFYTAHDFSAGTA